MPRKSFCHRIAVLLVATASACSSSPDIGPDAAADGGDLQGFQLSDSPSAIRRLWKKKIQGLITDLAVSSSGNAILIGTIPDPENPTGRHQYRVSRFGRDGRQQWGVAFGHQVKSLALSDDASLAVVAHYGEQLVGLDAGGRIRWKFDAVCRPIVLSKARRVLCYHDDDAEPAVAFDLLDWNGAKLGSFPIRADVLALKVSSDDTAIAVGLNRGAFALVGLDLAAVWQRQVPGEVVDVAVRGGTRPSVAVLYGPSKDPGTRRAAVFDLEGNVAHAGRVESQAEQIEIDGQGGVLVYGNGIQGQYLARFEGDGKKLVQRWRRGAASRADYSSQMIAARDLAIIGFEDSRPRTRHSHLLGFDRDGKLRFNLPLLTEDGAYLYAQAFSETRAFLGVGTDDSYLSGWSVLPSE